MKKLLAYITPDYSSVYAASSADLIFNTFQAVQDVISTYSPIDTDNCHRVDVVLSDEYDVSYGGIAVKSLTPEIILDLMKNFLTVGNVEELQERSQMSETLEDFKEFLASMKTSDEDFDEFYSGMTYIAIYEEDGVIKLEGSFVEFVDDDDSTETDNNNGLLPLVRTVTNGLLQ
jgi:hypothetical protein